MKVTSGGSRPSPILMLAPLAFVLLAYNYAFNIPQQRELSARRATLEKLETKAEEVRHEHGHVMSDLSVARKEEKDFRARLDIARAAEAVAANAQEIQLAELFRPSRPATSMAKAIDLLESHRLICLENRSTDASSKGNAAATHESLRPIADLLGGAPKQGSTRSEYRIKLSGSYKDMREALHELLEAQPDVIPLAIEMEAPEDPSTERRTWVLTLLV